MFPNFQNCRRCEKDLKDNKLDSLQLGRKYARVFELGRPILSNYMFLEAHSFPRATLGKQVMFGGKYPSIFARQTEAIVYSSTI